MAKQKQNAQDKRATSGELWLEAQGISRRLPSELVLKPNGQPFAEPQLGMTQTTGIVAQLEWLMRPEPIGGAEPHVWENKQRLREHVLEALNQRLAEPPHSAGQSHKQFLNEILDALDTRKFEFDAQALEAQSEYARTQERLAKWQEQYRRDKNLLTQVFTLGNLLFAGQVSDSEAVRVWNRRETFHKAMNALRGAGDLTNELREDVALYARNYDALVIAARQQFTEALAQERRLTQELDARLWTLTPDSAQIASVLAGSSADPALLAEVFAAIREGGSEQMGARVMEIAQREAERLAQGLSIAECIKMEAEQYEPAELEVDPLLLVGISLVEQVTAQFPTWSLIPQARPRSQTLQLTPHGAPLFEHPDLSTARYGERQDRLGFLDAQMDVALNELRVMQEGAESFHATRQQREFFILEPLVEAFPLKASSPSLASPPPTPRDVTQSPMAVMPAFDNGAANE